MPKAMPGQNLVGVSPKIAWRVCHRLFAKDQGWLAAYFDAMSRISSEQQAHFCTGGPAETCL